MKNLTPAEARAINSLLSFAWADYEAMTEGDLKTYKWGKRWLKAAQSGTDKIKNIARRQRGAAKLRKHAME
jgi:hypothetical protein